MYIKRPRYAVLLFKETSSTVAKNPKIRHEYSSRFSAIQLSSNPRLSHGEIVND